jgi:hypothetical protein
LGIVVVTIGSVSNTLARVANNGYMPVDPQAYMEYNGSLANLPASRAFTEMTKLPLLGDQLYFPYAGGIFSPGDVLLCLGLLIIVIQYQKFRYEQTRL